jgi:two-component system, LytTR family, sensor kinase
MLQEVFILDWTTAFLESLGTNFILGLSLVISLRGLQYYQPSGDRVLTIIIAAAVLSGVVMVGDKYLFSLLSESDQVLEKMNRSMFFHGGFAFLANAAALSLTMQWNQLKDQQALQTRRDEAERLAKEAELLKLRHQLQPHFLFNSLNSINALINSKPEAARKMVHQLSNFLRGTIKSEEVKSVLLREELDHINLYLEIEKVRFGHRLQTVIDIDDAALELSVPPLLLQPLMENAIKFGLYGTTDDVLIQMTAASAMDMLKIQISNPFDKDVDTQAGTGFGLSLIERRLNLLFNRNDLLSINKEAATFTATIKIPQLK